MKTQNELSEKPDFSSLRKIMERFHEVPYGQFQQELDTWFTEGMQNGSNANMEFLSRLKDLASSIYHEAEVKQLLHDQSLGSE